MNYAEIQSSVADFLNRQDLTSVIPTFIALCEADLNRALRHRSMLGRSTATLDTQFTQLPSDFLEAKNVQLNTEPVKSLEFVSIEHADYLRRQYTTTGEPGYYTLVGSDIEVVPAPDSDYSIELTYYKTIPALASYSTNWLSNTYPDAYIYGALVHAAPYLKDDERLPVWGSLYEKVKGDLNFSSDRAEFSGARLVMRAK